MGQTLSEPVVEKHTDSGASDRFVYAVSEMQGWRISMEDAHATILSLPPVSASGEPDTTEGKIHPAFFAVYDGHGGSAVAKFTGATLHKRMAKLPAYALEDYEAALRRAFLATDEELRENPEFANDPSGCTAVAGLITADNKIIVANAGDSRSVLSVSGKEVPMSHDHKPGNKEENARITAAGGFVEFGRVNGNLALSRAVGDFEFKQNYALDAEHQVVTVNPDILTHDWTGEEEFLVVACDGIWDCLSNQQVVDFTRRAIANGDSLTKICEDMMEKCLAPDSELGGVGCDNMTVVIVALLGNRSFDEWKAWITERVETQIGHPTPESIPHVFKTAPVVRGPGGGVAGAASAVTGAAANVTELVGKAGGKMMGHGGSMTLQEILAASGLVLPAGLAAGLVGDDESEETTSDEEHIEEVSTLPDGESKSGSVRILEDDERADDPSTNPESTSETPSPPESSSSTVSAVQPSTTSSVASVGSPLVPSHPELSSAKSPPSSV